MTKDRQHTVLGWAADPWPDTEPHPAHPDLAATLPADYPLYSPAACSPAACSLDHAPSCPQSPWTAAQHPAPPRSSSTVIPHLPELYSATAHVPAPAVPPRYAPAHVSPYASSHQAATARYRLPPQPPPPAASFGAFTHARSAPIRSQRVIGRADATAGVSDRARFIRLTYLHLWLALLAFGGLLYLLMTQELLVARVSAPLIAFAHGGRARWAIVLAAFVASSWVASYWASHASSRAMQYAGLGSYVVAEALIFVPLLALVEWKTRAILARGGAEPHLVRDAALVTLGVFTALTASVFVSRKDFSFLRGGLAVAGGAALSLIALSLAFGFSLGLAFSVAMVLLAGAYILYRTSQVLAHHDPRQHVAAALALFSSVALMFWYVIRIFVRARD